MVRRRQSFVYIVTWDQWIHGLLASQWRFTDIKRYRLGWYTWAHPRRRSHQQKRTMPVIYYMHLGLLITVHEKHWSRWASAIYLCNNLSSAKCLSVQRYAHSNQLHWLALFIPCCKWDEPRAHCGVHKKYRVLTVSSLSLMPTTQCPYCTTIRLYMCFYSWESTCWKDEIIHSIGDCNGMCKCCAKRDILKIVDSIHDFPSFSMSTPELTTRLAALPFVNVNISPCRTRWHIQQKSSVFQECALFGVGENKVLYTNSHSKCHRPPPHHHHHHNQVCGW